MNYIKRERTSSEGSGHMEIQRSHSNSPNISDGYKYKVECTEDDQTINVNQKGKRSYDEMSVMDSPKICYLNLDFPSSYNYLKIKEYIEEEYGPIEKIELLKDNDQHFNGMVRLKFNNLFKCEQAKNVFQGKVVKGVKLSPCIVQVPDDFDDYDEEPDHQVKSGPSRKMKREDDFLTWRPDIDVWEDDPTGLYGFKPEFLRSLGITPPLEQWVCVTNVKCGKLELKTLMELAGDVLSCKMYKKGDRIGYVKFSHPIEAVQAVSMLHNQTFNGLKLHVSICPPIPDVLPKLLQGLGPGLGIDGEPLKDVVKHYARYAKGRSHSVNTVIFRNPEELCSFTQESIKINQKNNIKINPIKPSAPYQNLPSQFTQGPNKSLLQTPRFPQPNSIAQTPQMVPAPTPIAPRFPTPIGPRAIAQYTPTVRPVVPAMVNSGINNMFPNTQNSVTVEISNLPLSTTFPTLCQKMAAVGQVMSLQLTTPGCAIVKFANRMQAESCCQQYNNFVVMGNMLKTRFV